MRRRKRKKNTLRKIMLRCALSPVVGNVVCMLLVEVVEEQQESKRGELCARHGDFVLGDARRTLEGVLCTCRHVSKCMCSRRVDARGLLKEVRGAKQQSIIDNECLCRKSLV